MFLWLLLRNMEMPIHHSGLLSPNLQPGTMRVYITNGGPQNGSNIGMKFGPCPGSQGR